MIMSKKDEVKKMTQKEFNKMKKKAKAELSGQKLVALTQGKYHFLSLCNMYSRLGHLFTRLTKAAKHSLFAKSPLPLEQTIETLLNQYQEMGEEMKTIGTYLDMMGGEPVMKAADEEESKGSYIPPKNQIPLPPPKKKESVENEEEKGFVSNISPSNGHSPGEVADTMVPDEELENEQ